MNLLLHGVINCWLKLILTLESFNVNEKYYLSNCLRFIAVNRQPAFSSKVFIFIWQLRKLILNLCVHLYANELNNYYSWAEILSKLTLKCLHIVHCILYWTFTVYIRNEIDESSILNWSWYTFYHILYFLYTTNSS